MLEKHRRIDKNVKQTLKVISVTLRPFIMIRQMEERSTLSLKK